MKPILIAIAGGTASGKTTVVDEIINHFHSEDVAVICQDNYYKAQDDLSLEERRKINYDHPNSFDLDLLFEDLSRLMEGETIFSPVYDFKEHNRKKDETTAISATKVIILEGILALYDSRIRSLSDILIYVESDPDVRFIRRLKRDIHERGRDLDSVIMQYLSTVKPMYDEYIAPTKRFADIIIPNDTKHDVAIEILAAKIKDIIK
ncbi:MAG: uridine kinase [Anaeroplasmataceae bacterium]|nr:uridine kinase [Anaeroplasmataceae bacterium]MDE6414425.1 uridine kinase [Anaeroplasmataceae bacterium]